MLNLAFCSLFMKFIDIKRRILVNRPFYRCFFIKKSDICILLTKNEIENGNE